MSLEEFKTNLKSGAYYQKVQTGDGIYCKQMVFADSDLKDAMTLEAIPMGKARNPTIRKMTTAGGYSSITKLFIKPSIPFKVTFNGETYTISLMTLFHPSPVRLENVQHDAMLTLGDPGVGNRAKGTTTDAVILVPLVGSLNAGPSGDFISKIARYMTGVLQPDPVSGQYNTIDIPTGNDWDLSKLFPGTPSNGETLVATGYYAWSASAGVVKSTTPRIQTNPAPQADVWTYPYIPAGNSNVRYIMLKDPVPVNVFDLQTVRMLPATPAEQAIDTFVPSTLSFVTPKTCSTTPSSSTRETMANPETCDPFAGGVKSNALTQDTLVQILTGVLTTFGVLLAIYFAVKLFANTDWGFKLPRWGHLFGNYALNAPLSKAEKIPPTAQFTSVAEDHDDELARKAAERLGAVADSVENPIAKPREKPVVKPEDVALVEKAGKEAEAKRKADEEARQIEQARIEAEAKRKADEEEALRLIEDAEAEAEAEAKRREEEERLRAPGAAGTGLLGLDQLRENTEQEEARQKAEADLKRAEDERQALERKADEAEAKAREREKAFKDLEAEAEQAPRPRGKFAKTVVAQPKVPPPIIAEALKKKEAEQKKAEEAAAALAKQEEEVKRLEKEAKDAEEKEAEIKRLAEEAAKSASRAAERQTKSLAEPIMRNKDEQIKAEAERQRKEYAEKQAEEARTTAPGAEGRASASVPSAIGVPPPEPRKKQEEILDAYESAVKAYEANPTPETERKARGAESRAKGPARNTPELTKRYMELVQRFERAKADVQKAHDKAEATRDGLMKRLQDRMSGVKSARTDVTLLWQRNPTPIALKGREDKVQGELDRLQTVIRDTKEKVNSIEPEDRALLNFKIKEAEKLVAEQQKISQSNYAAFKEMKSPLGIKGGRRRMKRKSTRRYVA